MNILELGAIGELVGGVAVDRRRTLVLVASASSGDGGVPTNIRAAVGGGPPPKLFSSFVAQLRVGVFVLIDGRTGSTSNRRSPGYHHSED